MFDMNDAEPQKTSELIPDGTFAKVTMTIRPGGIDGQSEIDQALLKAPKDPTSDVRMLDCEFTVVEGPHVKRKFWQMFTVQGGKVDENGVSIGWKISKSTFRAMIDSALGLDPQDMSEAAKQKRVLRGSRRSQQHHLHRQDQDRAERGRPLRRSEPPRPRGAADRQGMEARHGRQGRAGEPEPLARRRQQGRGHTARLGARHETRSKRTAGPSQSRSPQASAAPAWSQSSPGGAAPSKPAGPAWLNG